MMEAKGGVGLRRDTEKGGRKRQENAQPRNVFLPSVDDTAGVQSA